MLAGWSWDGEKESQAGVPTLLEASGEFWEERTISSGVSLPLRRPTRRLFSSKRSWREDLRCWTARVARAPEFLWASSIWLRSMELRTSTLWRKKGSLEFPSRKN